MEFIEYYTENEKYNGFQGTESLYVYWLFTLLMAWLMESCGWLSCPAPWERNLLNITSPGKDQNSKSEVQFLLNVYHLHTTIKSKNPKMNHYNLGTVCSLTEDKISIMVHE